MHFYESMSCSLSIRFITCLSSSHSSSLAILASLLLLSMTSGGGYLYEAMKGGIFKLAGRIYYTITQQALLILTMP